MRVAMMSRDTSKPKICGRFAAITKICELLQKMRSLLDFVINSAIAESQNPISLRKKLFLSLFLRDAPVAPAGGQQVEQLSFSMF